MPLKPVCSRPGYGKERKRAARRGAAYGKDFRLAW